MKTERKLIIQKNFDFDLKFIGLNELLIRKRFDKKQIICKTSF